MRSVLELATSITTQISLAALIVIASLIYLLQRTKSDRELASKAVERGSAAMLAVLTDTFHIPASKITEADALAAIKVQLRYRTIKNLFVFVVVLAIVIALVILLSGAGRSDLCDGEPSIQLRSSGWAAFQSGNYDAAERAANALNGCDPKDYTAYNILGSTAFFRRNYDRAVSKFEDSIRVAPPRRPGLMENLADALVEQGLRSAPDKKLERLTRALKLYGSVSNPGDFVAYKSARVQLFLEELQAALVNINTITPNYGYEAAPGKVQILQGAIYIRMSEQFPNKEDEYVELARRSFLAGLQQDREFWRNVFLNNKNNPGEPFEHITVIYGASARKWVADGA